MQLLYFGHSACWVEIPGANGGQAIRFVLDPWLSDNPHGAVDPAKVPCEFVFCSHAHSDHIQDALTLARLHRATIVAPYELAAYFAAQGATTIDLMPGGGVDFPWGRLQLTPAVHSSALELPNGENRPMGCASGLILRADRVLYHAGDTALFGDMALIGRQGLDLALIPIGDYYTMGPTEALAALDFLRPRVAVPIHYNTSEKIRIDPLAFARQAAGAGHRVRVLQPGEYLKVE